MKKVAIVGFGKSMDEAPFNDKSYEIWGLNDLYDKIPRWDRWFDIHSFDEKTDQNSIKGHQTNRAKDQKLAAYKKMTCPVYCQEAWEEIPNAEKFPLEEIEAKFCGGEKGYFTNQPSYMVALAIYLDFDVIELYGVDMAIDTEYSVQRPSVEYWLGLARGMGKTVYVPASSTLLKVLYRYGFDKKSADVFSEMYRAKMKFLVEMKEKSFKDLDKAKASFHQFSGAFGKIQELTMVLGENEVLKKELAQANENRNKSAVDVENCKTVYYQYLGAVEFCQTILKEWDSNVQE